MNAGILKKAAIIGVTVGVFILGGWYYKQYYEARITQLASDTESQDSVVGFQVLRLPTDATIISARSLYEYVYEANGKFYLVNRTDSKSLKPSVPILLNIGDYDYLTDGGLLGVQERQRFSIYRFKWEPTPEFVHAQDVLLDQDELAISLFASPNDVNGTLLTLNTNIQDDTSPKWFNKIHLLHLNRQNALSVRTTDNNGVVIEASDTVDKAVLSPDDNVLLVLGGPTRGFYLGVYDTKARELISNTECLWDEVTSITPKSDVVIGLIDFASQESECLLVNKEEESTKSVKKETDSIKQDLAGSQFVAVQVRLYENSTGGQKSAQPVRQLRKLDYSPVDIPLDVNDNTISIQTLTLGNEEIWFAWSKMGDDANAAILHAYYKGHDYKVDKFNLSEVQEITLLNYLPEAGRALFKIGDNILLQLE